MKRIIFISLFFISLNGTAQKMQNFDTSFSDNVNINFFIRNISIDHLRFSYEFPYSKNIVVYFKKETVMRIHTVMSFITLTSLETPIFLGKSTEVFYFLKKKSKLC
jgi:hypothetical protein